MINGLPKPYYSYPRVACTRIGYGRFALVDVITRRVVVISRFIGG